MVDVGQGDCTLVITPTGKTILVDGGGSSKESDFDVGERIVVPYLLNKGIRQIDYLVFSHFDADHCMGLLPVLQHLSVKQILLTKQAEIKEEYMLLIQEAMQKKVPIQIVTMGDTITIENNITLQILFPDTTFLSENAINNNAMVMRLVAKDVSILFTGDIEEIAEKQILQKVSSEQLKADILKVAHHGSKSSSSEAFLKAVNPKIAMIGVGAKNTFGHPSQEVLDRLEALDCKIYRTDQMGEITIKVSNKGKIKIHTQIEAKNV